MLRALVLVPLLIVNLCLWGGIIVVGGLVKLVTWGAARRAVILAMAWLGERWVICNNLLFDALLRTEWDIQGLDAVRHDGRYLVTSNHLSWIDILAVQRAFSRRAPFVRFFLKRILLLFPIVGLGCWSLEFPFMRRYSREYLEKHPEKRGLDLQTTRVACERYRRVPVTVLNFAEGTRFTPEKQKEQASPYRHLLRPRIGGISLVLAAMADQLDAVYDLTIIYPGGDATIIELITNRIPRVIVRARRLEIPPGLLVPSITEPGPERERFRAWIEEIWAAKDALISRLA